MEGTPEALSCVGRFLASRGTGAFLATTVSAPVDVTLRSLEGLAKVIAQAPVEGEAKPIGIHLEGPFLSHAKRGAHPANRLLAPDIGVFDRMFEAAQGYVRLITLAPELPGAAELAAHATSRGVRVSVGHSDANACETRGAIDAGAVSATHTYNAMRVLDHKNPGILETVLTTDELYAELICDGIHNMPELVRLWWRAKGPEKAILVTDAMSATGMPDGEYQLGDFPVRVANGRAMIGEALAGSVLTLDKALANFVQVYRRSGRARAAADDGQSGGDDGFWRPGTAGGWGAGGFCGRGCEGEPAGIGDRRFGGVVLVVARSRFAPGLKIGVATSHPSDKSKNVARVGHPDLPLVFGFSQPLGAPYCAFDARDFVVQNGHFGSGSAQPGK